MTFAPLILLYVLPSLSGVAAHGSCDSGLISSVSKQDQLPYPAIEYLQDETFWIPLSTKDDVSGIKSVQITFNSLTSKNTVEAISKIASNGKTTSSSATYSKLSGNSIYVKESYGTYKHFCFICSDKMIGVFRCQDGAKGKAHLFAIAKTINPASDLKGELETCKSRMKAIDSSAQIVELSHP